MIPPFLKRKNPCRKNFHFQTIVTPEVRRLCLNFTLNQLLASPQISPLITSWLLEEKRSPCRLWQLTVGGIAMNKLKSMLI
jgi:hypothetical protein